MVFEIECNGKKSGLSTTTAVTWAVIFSFEGNVEFTLMFNVDKLKKRLLKLHHQKKARIVMGGDNDMSKMFLVPIQEMLDL